MTARAKLKIGPLITCGQPTKKGLPCRMEMRKEGQICWRHRA